MNTWVRISVAAASLGYTVNAIRCKIKKGVWILGVHYRKAPDGCIFLNLQAIDRWIEGKPA
jgi:hypothetical protein